MKQRKTIKNTFMVTLAALLVSGFVVVGSNAVGANDGGDWSRSGETDWSQHDGQDWKAKWQAGYKLDVLLHEHTSLTVTALRAQHMQLPDTVALNATIDANSTALADSVEAVYPGTRDEFFAKWQARRVAYQEYVLATSLNDETGKQAAKQKMVTLSQEISVLLDSKSERVDQAKLQEKLTMQGDMVIGTIDKFAASDITGAYTLSHEAYLQTGEVTKAMFGLSIDIDFSVH